MPRDKIKPPTESKAELMMQISALLEKRHTSQADDIDFLLGFFSSADLVGIREELKK